MGTEKQLAEIIGEDEARKIVKRAEKRSKELERAGVKFKDSTSVLSGKSLDAVAAYLTTALSEAIDPTIEMLKNTIFDLHERINELERPIALKVQEQLSRQSRSVVRRTTQGKGADQPLVLIPSQHASKSTEQRNAELDAFWNGFGSGPDKRDLGE